MSQSGYSTTDPLQDNKGLNLGKFGLLMQELTHLMLDTTVYTKGNAHNDMYSMTLFCGGKRANIYKDTTSLSVD